MPLPLHTASWLHVLRIGVGWCDQTMRVCNYNGSSYEKSYQTCPSLYLADV